MEQSKILFSKEQIEIRIKELAEQINKDYKGKKLVIVGVLKGAFIVTADLIRALCSEGLEKVEIDFLTATSYGRGTTYSGKTKILADITTDILGQDVLIVEDIIDTGYTFRSILNHINKKKPASLKTLALLDKEERREVKITLDYIGFKLLGSPWVEGYGLDGGE